MKKAIIALAALALLAPGISAQKRTSTTAKKRTTASQKSTFSTPKFELNNSAGYSRVTVSYDLTHISDIDNSCNLNGAALGYVYGTGLVDNLFAETGVNFNYQVGSNKSVDMKFTALQVPLNLVYRIAGLAQGLDFAPYVGLNLKYNTTGKFTEKISKVSVDVFDSKDMGGDDYTFNRFQPGWHAGVGVNSDNIYLGLEFGTDFRPLYKVAENTWKTSNLKIVAGYAF